MQIKNLYTTPLLLPSEKWVMQEVPVAKPSFWRFYWIAVRLAGLLLIATKAEGTFSPATVKAMKIRAFLEEMGGMWIKLGQVLAMRSDLFSQEFCKELGKLQDRAMTFSPQLSVAIIEQQLGKPIDMLFEEFEREPFAAASLSQVHKARLKAKGEDEGQVVVVKVQRPFVRDYFRYDFRWLNFVFRFLGQFQALRHYQFTTMLAEIQLMMEAEVDYRQEASNMILFKETLEDHKVYVPTVHLDLSAERVLVMEYIDGVFMSHLNTVMKDDPARAHAWLDENGIDTKLVARRLLQSSFRQLFEDLVFHGDLHFGNIILLKNNNFALIDFGNVGRLDSNFAGHYDRYFRAMAEGSYDRAADVLLIIMSPLPRVDLDELKLHIVRALERQAIRSSITNLSYNQKSMGSSSAELSQIMAKYKIGANWHYLNMARMFETVDQNIALLNPEFDFVEEMQLYLEARRCRTFWKRLGWPFEFMCQVDDLFQILAPQLTRRAIQRDVEPPAKDQLTAMALRGFAFGLVAALSFLVWIYLDQHHPNLVRGIDIGEPWARAIDSVPVLHRYVWWALGAVIVVMIVRLRRIAAAFVKQRVE